MLNIDAKGILKNTGRRTPIFPGMRATTTIRADCMTTSVLTFDNPVSINESIPASITFIAPKYYGNSLWIDKSLDIYEGSKIIGTFTVIEIINAFNDLLWGGFGIHEYEEPLHIVWIFAEKSRQALGNKYFNKIISIIENHESQNKYLELYDEHVF